MQIMAEQITSATLFLDKTGSVVCDWIYTLQPLPVLANPRYSAAELLLALLNLS